MVRWWRVWGLTHGLDVVANPLDPGNRDCALSLFPPRLRGSWGKGKRVPYNTVAGRPSRADVPKLPQRRDTPRRPCYREPFGLSSVANSTKKVEGPGTQEVTESVNGSRVEVGPDVTSKLSSLFAGIPSLAGPQRLASSLRQKFANNSGKFANVL
ncbi:hypothetical protein ANTQUA_LOCUS842 [Anthophora quadrimaculata]